MTQIHSIIVKQKSLHRAIESLHIESKAVGDIVGYLDTKANLNVSGGGKVATYYVAGGYDKETGILNVDGRNNFNNNKEVSTNYIYVFNCYSRFFSYLCRMKNLKEKLEKITPYFNERQWRIVCAAEAEYLGRGGKSLVCKATGMSRPTLNHGLRELSGQLESTCDMKRIRREGAGRKQITTEHPDLVSALESLVEPLSRGDPESPLRWTIKSTRNLSEELFGMGYKVCKSRVATLLKENGYSLQSNKKTIEGHQHPDRNAQFEHTCTLVSMPRQMHT
jgi:transposase